MPSDLRQRQVADLGCLSSSGKAPGGCGRWLPMGVQHFGVTPRLLRSVDIELVAFRVLHPDRVVVEPFPGQCASDGGAQAGQPAGLRVDALPASPDRVGPLATGVDVEVQPVLDHLGLRDGMEPDAPPVALRAADPVRPIGQLLLGHPQLAVEVVPGSESIRDRRELIAQRGGPEPGQPVRVGTVDDQLKADRHRFPPQATRVAADILPDAKRRQCQQQRGETPEPHKIALAGPPHFRGNPRNVGCMEEAAPDREPDNSSGKGDTSGRSPAASGSVAVAAPPAAALGAAGIQLPVWTKALGWCGIAGLIYLLICAVSIISRGFAGLGGEAAHSMFAFAANPWVGLSVGVLGTVLIQSSTTTTAIAVTAVGSGALPIRGAIPIILGANVGTTVTTTLVALTFIGSRTEFRRALAASTIHDFYNLLALLIFFPLELISHPGEGSGGAMTKGLYGRGWVAEPDRFNFIRPAIRPVVDGVTKATSHLSSTLGPLFTIVIGAALILVAVLYLGKLLKPLMVGRARDVLIKAVGRNAYLAMASGMGVTVLTQSSTITTSVLVPFAGAGILAPEQVYPVPVGANRGTKFTVGFAGFPVLGPSG